MKTDNIVSIKPLGFQWETSDPFLFCVHHEDQYPAANEAFGPDASLAGRNIGQDFTLKDGWRMYHGRKVPGFPVHPHRGFETVTIVRQGYIDHSDSLGAAGRYASGDVQWMTAGRGIQHSEMFPLLDREAPNPCELFQVWLNLPAKSKFADPGYKMLWKEDIPTYHSLDKTGKSVKAAVIAGCLGDSTAPSPTPDSWAFNAANEVAIFSIVLEEGVEWTLPAAKEGVNRTLYFFKGEGLRVDGREIPSYHAIQVRPDADIEIEGGDQECQILLLQGKPIAEQVAKYGPFVMNTQEEIQHAFADYRRTQFGGWPWPDNDQVHGPEPRRFAKHADGTLEQKDVS